MVKYPLAFYTYKRYFKRAKYRQCLVDRPRFSINDDGTVLVKHAFERCALPTRLSRRAGNCDEHYDYDYETPFSLPGTNV